MAVDQSSERAVPPAMDAASTGNRWGALLRALRPRQWIKNGFLFAGILFTLDQRHRLHDWLLVLAGFAIFCALSSSIYLINDICDREQDRLHPRKKQRAVASGQVSVTTAITVSILLAAAGLLAAALTRNLGFFAAAAGYVGLTLLYSYRLKHVVLLDVMALAAGFVLRAIAGAAIIRVEISPWLLVCTTFLALFLGLAKRRHEIDMLQSDAVGHRRILEEYSLEMLDQLITIVTASLLISYAFYTFISHAAARRPLLMLTLPFVIYGVFRFLYLVHRRGGGGNPAADLLDDWPLVLTAVLWAAASALIVVSGR